MNNKKNVVDFSDEQKAAGLPAVSVLSQEQ